MLAASSCAGVRYSGSGRPGALWRSHARQRSPVVEIVEKPERPNRPYTVTSSYIYDAEAVEVARWPQPAVRGELQTTDVSLAYLERGTLAVERIDRGYS